MSKGALTNLFHSLDKAEISYYLLRPLDLSKPLTDIDLVIPYPQIQLLTVTLQRNYTNVRFKYTAYNKTIRILADDLILDIQFYIAFLPRKSLILKKNPIYSSIIFIEDKKLILPDVKNEVLFTFWALRLFLDKDRPYDSGSFQNFKLLFQKNWEILLKSDYFNIWVFEIFGKKSAQALSDIITFFESGFNDDNGTLNRGLRKLVFTEKPFLIIKMMSDELKFRLLRVVGKYDKTYSINKLF